MIEVNEDNLGASPEASPGDVVVSRGVDGNLASPREPTVVSRDAVLTTSLGPGPATYVSKAHAVEFELQAGSLEEELSLEMTITQGLTFVDCSTEGSRRWNSSM